MNIERHREKRTLAGGSLFIDLCFMERGLIKYTYILRTASGIPPYAGENPAPQFLVSELSVCLN